MEYGALEAFWTCAPVAKRVLTAARARVGALRTRSRCIGRPIGRGTTAAFTNHESIGNSTVPSLVPYSDLDRPLGMRSWFGSISRRASQGRSWRTGYGLARYELERSVTSWQLRRGLSAYVRWGSNGGPCLAAVGVPRGGIPPLTCFGNDARGRILVRDSSSLGRPPRVIPSEARVRPPPPVAPRASTPRRPEP